MRICRKAVTASQLLMTISPLLFTTQRAFAQIYLNGQDVTGATTTVAVGQELTLSGKPTTVNGRTQGFDFDPSEPASSYTILPAGQCPIYPKQESSTPCDYATDAYANVPSYTIFFTEPGKHTATYSNYTQTANGVVENFASTTFNVVAPTVTVTSSVAKVVIANQQGVEMLSLGNASTGVTGISFNDNVIQPLGFLGTTSWVQVISQYVTTYKTSVGAAVTCNAYGLDGGYPYLAGYSTPTFTSDSPAVALPSANSEVLANFGAVMDLEWTPPPYTSGAGVVPVVIATIGWAWSGDAVQNNGVWSFNPDGINSGISPVVDISYRLYTDWYDDLPDAQGQSFIPSCSG